MVKPSTVGRHGTFVDGCFAQWWNHPMRRAAILAAASGLAALALSPRRGHRRTTRSCRQINGVPIHTHNLSLN
jgi:hypothetical protein